MQAEYVMDMRDVVFMGSARVTIDSGGAVDFDISAEALIEPGRVLVMSANTSTITKIAFGHGSEPPDVASNFAEDKTGISFRTSVGTSWTWIFNEPVTHIKARSSSDVELLINFFEPKK